MGPRRLLRRTLKLVLYTALLIVLLSLGLRTYSAWELRKAKHLISDMSRLRAGQVFDRRIQNVMSEYGFRKLDSHECSAVHCEFGTGFSVSYPFSYTVDSDNFSDIVIHWVEETGGKLGYRSWFVFAN